MSPLELPAPHAGTATPPWAEAAEASAHRTRPAPIRSTPIDPLGRSALLRRLFVLMVGARMAMASVGAVLLLLWHQPLGAGPSGPVAAAVAIAAGLTVAAALRLRTGGPIGENTFLVHLLGDVVTITFLLSQLDDRHGLVLCVFLLPLSLAAYAMTGLRLAAAMGGVVLAVALLYALHGARGASPYAVAHEASELAAIVLAAVVAYAVATVLRRHEQAVLRLREAAVTEQGSMALAAMAVRTADVISTPLATMSVLVHDLRVGHLPAADASAALDELGRQIERCKAYISDIVASAGRARADSGQRLPLDGLVESAAQQCELMTPAIQIERVATTATPPDVVDERSLADALVLLIQHHGRRGPGVVRVESDWNERSVFVRVCSTTAAEATPEVGDDPMVALAASLLGRWSGTLRSEEFGAHRCSHVELPRATVCPDPLPP